jgi:hypothetical protein
VCDGSRDSASDISDDAVVVATKTNQQEISYNIADKGQGTILGAVTAVTAVTCAESRNNTADTQISVPHTIDLQQTRSETIRNAGRIYWSGTNHCPDICT